MRLEPVVTVAKREYLTRIRTKGFWIATILLPLLMGVWIFVPALVIERTTAGERLAVVDETGRIAGPLVGKLTERELAASRRARFEVEILPPAGEPAAQRTALDRMILDDRIDAWIWIDQRALADNRVSYHAESVSNFLTQDALEDALTEVMRQERLSAAGYDLDEITALSRPVSLDTVRVSEEGSRSEAGEGGFFLAFALFFVLYMVIILYGQQVMQGVLEEKSSRIVEVIVSAVRPVEMMAGKLAGICLLGLTQLAIWIATSLVLTAPGILGAMAMMPEEMPIPHISAALVAHFFLHFLLGYFLFATFYAMLGAAFNNMQEAQQLAGVAVIFLIAPFVFMFPVINDPDSPLAVTLSLIPVFTPLVMMLRIAVKMPPGWQILLGYLLTTGFIAVMIALAARVYRVGILMYGKKPTLKELWRWVRYA